MNITIFFLMLNLNPIAQDQIHPALIADYNQLIKCWDKGYSDARTINSTDKVLDVSKKNYRTYSNITAEDAGLQLDMVGEPENICLFAGLFGKKTVLGR